MAESDNYLRNSLDIMSREISMGVVFLIQLALSSLIFYIGMVLAGHWDLWEAYPGEKELLFGALYPLFSFSILVLSGIASIFIMLITGSIVEASIKGKRVGFRKHVSRAVSNLPLSTVIFLFFWIGTFGISVIVMFLLIPESDDFAVLCLMTATFYILLWFILGRTFFAPFMVMDGVSREKVLRKSSEEASRISGTLTISTLTATFLSTLILVMGIESQEGLLIPLLAVIFSLFMQFSYVYLAYLHYSGAGKRRASSTPPYGMLLGIKPVVLLVGFSEEEVHSIRKSGIPAVSLADWARKAPLSDIADRPAVYEGKSTWYPHKVAIFAGVEQVHVPRLSGIIKDTSGDVIISFLSPMNSSYMLDDFLRNLAPEKAAKKQGASDKKKDES